MSYTVDDRKLQAIHCELGQKSHSLIHCDTGNGNINSMLLYSRSYPRLYGIVVFKGIHATDMSKYVSRIEHVFFLNHNLQI